MYLCICTLFVFFPLTIYVTENPGFKWGQIHGEETSPCLLIQERVEVSLGKEVILFTPFFQRTEDSRLRRRRSTRTPCYSSISLEGPWVLTILAYIKSFLCCLFRTCGESPKQPPLCGSRFPATGFLSPLPFAETWQEALAPPCTAHLQPQPLFSRARTLDTSASPTTPPRYLFSLPY